MTRTWAGQGIFKPSSTKTSPISTEDMSTGCTELILCVCGLVLRGFPAALHFWGRLLPSEHLAGLVSPVGGAGPRGPDGSKGSYRLPILALLLGWPWGFSLVFFLCLTLLLRGCWKTHSRDLYLVYLENAQ